METKAEIDLKRQLIEMSNIAMTNAETLYKAIRFFPEPKITDLDSWWTGKNRVIDCTTWQEAHNLWQSKK